MHGDGFIPAAGWALPFAGLLLAIAILPLTAPHFWDSNLRKLMVAGALALPVLALYTQVRPEALGHAASDYVSFIILLGGLFVISGGILLEGDLEATTRTNALLLGTGALLASFIGTTGASMVLIRPLLQTNRERKRVAHTVVFFIWPECPSAGRSGSCPSGSSRWCWCSPSTSCGTAASVRARRSPT
jgi:Na+/H+ antiporter NhaD/arsenite permease-like protein